MLSRSAVPVATADAELEAELLGRCSREIPMWSMSRIPRRACRSGTCGHFGTGTGNDGDSWSNEDSSSETICRLELLFVTNGPNGNQVDIHMINRFR